MNAFEQAAQSKMEGAGRHVRPGSVEAAQVDEHAGVVCVATSYIYEYGANVETETCLHWYDAATGKERPDRWFRPRPRR